MRYFVIPFFNVSVIDVYVTTPSPYNTPEGLCEVLMVVLVPLIHKTKHKVSNQPKVGNYLVNYGLRCLLL
jgi:hypothetical protein